MSADDMLLGETRTVNVEAAKAALAGYFASRAWTAPLFDEEAHESAQQTIEEVAAALGVEIPPH